jgi:hypothetical protein
MDLYELAGIPKRTNKFSNSNAAKIIADNEGNFGIIGAVDNTNRGLLENSRFSYVGHEGRLLQYPLDLGTDSTHYMIFNIYETDGASIVDNDWEAAKEKLTGQYNTHKQNQNELLEERDKKNKIAQDVGLFGMLGDEPAFMEIATRAARQAHDAGYSASVQAVKAEDKQKQLKELEIKAINSKDKREMFGTKVSSTRVNEPKIVGKDSIVLYMPQKINSMNMIDYDLEAFDTVKAAQNAYNRFSDMSLEGVVAGAGSLGGMIVGKILKAAGEVASTVGIGSPMDVLKVFGRIAINPQKEMLFNSPAPRKYEFAFEFAPRNKEESEQARNIVQLFKYHAFPSTTLGFGLDKLAEKATKSDANMSVEEKEHSTWYRMPSEFQFEYMHIDKSNGQEIAKENHFINRAERCVLSEVNVDYSGAGTFQSFEDGSPTHITLTLTFAEARLITQEHIAKGY